MSYDAVIVGAGPNGLAAGITLAQAGKPVLVLEAKETIGGGTRSAELTLPGFVHDICSALHPLGVASPFFRELPLAQYGLDWVFPPASLAHPLDDGTAVMLEGTVADTAANLGPDAAAYRRLMGPLVDGWRGLLDDVLGPLRFPANPLRMARFGMGALLPAATLARLVFRIKVRDINALKTFRREVLEEINLRRDWHRYIVPLAAARGFSVAEVPVSLRPRLHGEPKYSGRFRILIGLFDMVAVGFQLSFMRKPMLHFGMLGSVALLSGFVVGVVAVVLRLFGHGFRPLLYLVLLLVVVGLVLFAAGLLGEALASVNDRLERLERLSRDGGED